MAHIICCGVWYFMGCRGCGLCAWLGSGPASGLLPGVFLSSGFALPWEYVVSFSVAPTVSDPDGSVHRAVADAVAIVRASGLPHQTGPMFTTIEGEWDECMDVIRRATEAVGKYGPRVSLVIKADIRPGHDHGEIEGKVQRLNAAIEQLDSGK